MKISRYLSIVLLICIGFAFATADAQENLAQEVSTVFQQSCLKCHGPSGSFKEALLIDRTTLVDTQVVIPGDPENSEFYKRLLGPTENGPQMPLNLPPLSQEAIETIARWITVGAPDWNVQRDINFITTDTILDTIRNHLKSLDPFDRPSARYFTMTHLYNAGETPETLSDYQIALSKLINSLSWKFEITNPTPIDEAQTIFHIDLRRYEWNTTTDVWPQIEQVYPYNIAFDPEIQAGLLEKLTQLQTETGSTVPFVHVDWFLATASLPPLYHDILDLPQTDRILETQLGVNVASNITNAPGIDVWRAGFNDSGVSRHNRVVERHTSRYGAYWKSYDFAGSAESQNIFTYPLDFTHDGGEIIFNLPNGLQAYLLVDANGNRLNDAPINIVSNPAASDPTVRNGLSCIGCHTQGMKKFEDSVRAAIKQDENPPYNKEHALRLYPEQSVLDELLQKDTVRFQQALEKIGGPFADDASRERFFKQHENEPVQRFHELFQAPLNASDAAAAVGLETEAFLTQIREKQSLKNLGLQTLIDVNGTVKRDAWTSNFDQVISALNTPDSVLPPVVQRPERIPGESVRIPDENLRAAIAETLGKAPGDVITTEDMETLTRLDEENMGISKLTGLEFAINLHSINLSGNEISDISPLTGLINLRDLVLVDNLISDISGLKGLINLTHLNLWDNPVSDLSPLIELTGLSNLSLANQAGFDLGVVNLAPLTGLTNLIRLSFHNITVSDLSFLSGLINLERISFANNGVSDLSPLAGLINLKYIHTWGNPTSDFSFLTKLKKLEKVDICGGENVSDLSPLASLTALQELYLVKNGISDVLPLAGLTELTRLNLAENDISDVSPLASLTNLTWLKLSNNPITDFSSLEALSQNTNILMGEVDIPDRNLRSTVTEALGKENAAIVSITTEEMTTLTTLRASNRGIKDLTGIENAINLEELWISGNPITDLSPLAALKNLIGLAAWDMDIEDFSPLAELTNLRWLELFNTPISDLSPLARLTSLKRMSLYGTGTENLSPLAGLTNLTQLQIANNETLSDVSSLAGLINLEWLDLHRCDSLSDLSPLAGLTKLEYLNLNHTRRVSDYSLAPLSGLTELRRLRLAENMISDISPLSELISLVRLDLPRNEIVDLSPLSGLAGLTELYLNANMISDVSPLAELINLEWLDLRVNQIADISSLDGLAARTYISWLKNPGAPIEGPKIGGPWLWVPIPEKQLDDKTDLLSEVSGGSVTEHQIAMKGAMEGEAVGNYEWAAHKISSTGLDNGIINNMQEIIRAFGLPEEYEWKTEVMVVYGSVILDSPREQKTRMFVGSEGRNKVWLNGELIYEQLIRPTEYDYWWDDSDGCHQYFPVTLKPGANVLLVAVGNGGTLTGHFGFEEGTEYTVMPPGVGFTFSATQTNLLAGDTFTLNLNAEKVSDLAGWQADIAYDHNVLEVVKVTEGDFLKAQGGDTFFQDGAIDNTTGKIIDLFSARISESGVNGIGTLLSVTFKAKAGGETQVTLENFEFSSISGAIIPTVPPNITVTVGDYPAWDVNQDGRVSVTDLVLVAKDLGSDAPANLRTDVNRDGTINIQDLILVAQHLGESTDAAAPSATINDLDLLDPATIQAWITQAQIEDDGSIAFRQAIATLERLLTLFIPEETALLHNYPNPFNPETWIPYQLAESAEVTLTIYSVNGTLVRTLKLGHQPAGIYQTRTRAAYWDGRNEVGEPVASGVYFYTLSTESTRDSVNAGDFNATRKMLIRK
ncbi:hypothetical protein F4141_25795 [Candidatus Poribacteria bacterium]|nr:hypothetical protein [Candidatus Poribacteria bacterium]